MVAWGEVKGIGSGKAAKQRYCSRAGPDKTPTGKRPEGNGKLRIADAFSKSVSHQECMVLMCGWEPSNSKSAEVGKRKALRQVGRSDHSRFRGGGRNQRAPSKNRGSPVEHGICGGWTESKRKAVGRARKE